MGMAEKIIGPPGRRGVVLGTALAVLAGTAVLAGAHGVSARVHPAAALEQVVRPGMLRVPVAQLEARTGPARQVLDVGNGFSRRSYLVQGCAVDAYARGGRVEQFQVPLTPDCTVDLSPFLGGRNFPPANRMSVADFIAVAGPGEAPDDPGSFRSACIERCGGGDDPSVSYLRRSSEAEGFPEVEISAAIDDSRSADAAGRLVRALREREDEAYVREARFSCDGRYAWLGVQIFRAVRLSAVRIGYGINEAEDWLLAKCPNLRS